MAPTFDEMFANSPAETKTTTEKGFIEGFAKQIGDIGSIMIAILVAVLFTILLVVGNTMAQAVRERTSELAVLKTLGFSNGAILPLVLAESLFIAVARRRPRPARWPGSSSQRGDPTGGLLPAFVLPQRRSAARHRADGRRSACWPGVLPASARCGCKITDALRKALTCPGLTPDRRRHAGSSLRTIPQRLGSSAVAVVGIAGVVDRVRGRPLDRAGLLRRDAAAPARPIARSSCAAAPTTR